jgi:uncharacterized protein (TIGR00369 family)
MSTDVDFLEYARKRRVPFLEHLKIEPVAAGGGKSAFEVTVEEFHLRTFGILHGGVTAALLDTAVGFAAVTVAPPDHHVVTVQLNANFVRMVTAGEKLITTGEVQHAGKMTAVVRGEVRTAAGDLAATGTATMIYLPIPEDAKQELDDQGMRVV